MESNRFQGLVSDQDAVFQLESPEAGAAFEKQHNGIVCDMAASRQLQRQQAGGPESGSTEG